MTKIKIAILVVDKTLVFSAIGLAEIFSLANTKSGEDLYSYEFISDSSSPNLSNSDVTLKTTPLDSRKSHDIIIIPPLLDDGYLLASDKVISWIKKKHTQGVLMTSVCAGSFLFARANIIGDKKVTTHWDMATKFEYEFPGIKLEASNILIDEGTIITAGGVNSYIDLAIHLISKTHSKKLAYDCSRLLVTDTVRPSQSPYKDVNYNPAVQDVLIIELINWLNGRLNKTTSNMDMAKFCKLGERTFLRRFKKVLNTTPNSFLQLLRVEKAKELLALNNDSFEEITIKVGFEDPSTFRKLFRKVVSLSPAQYRNQLGI